MSIAANSRRLALIASAVVLLCIVLCLCAVFLGHRGRLESLAREHDNRMGFMAAQAAVLRETLAADPCEAMARLGAEKGDKPGAGESGGAAQPAAAGASLTAERVEKACAFIVSVDKNRRLLTGTGFFIAPGLLVTNRHVVGGSGGRILVTSKAMPRPAFARLAGAGSAPGEDYALLEVDLPPGSDVACLDIGGSPVRTAKVGAWGFPHVVGKNDPAYARLLSGADVSEVPELSYTEGVVSAVLERRSPPLVVHTAPISPGNSGGPLVDAQGRVVGINTMITLDEDSYRQASIALDASDLKRFLESRGVGGGGRP